MSWEVSPFFFPYFPLIFTPFAFIRNAGFLLKIFKNRFNTISETLPSPNENWVIGLWFWNITPDILMPGWPCYMFQLFLNRSRLCQNPAACEDPQMKVNTSLSSLGRSSVPVPSAPMSRSHHTLQIARRGVQTQKSVSIYLSQRLLVKLNKPDTCCILLGQM